MKILTGMLIAGLTISTAAEANSYKTLDEETMKTCIQLYKKIDYLEDNKRHKDARKYKSKMLDLRCPTRHNRYFD
jgi:hypothetical protein